MFVKILLTWSIHESRLLQLRGVEEAAVVVHPESPSQQSRCSEIGSPEREIWPKFSLEDLRK
jgi:hypothetical protein